MEYELRDHIKGNTLGEIVFQLIINGNSVDLTGATIDMGIKEHVLTDVGYTLSTENGKMSITDPVEGVFKIVQQIIDFEPNLYNYDIKITFPDNVIKTYVTGKWKIIQNVI